MILFSSSRHARLNEAAGLILFLLGLAVLLGLLSFAPSDPSWDTASGVVRTHNLLGPFGAVFADFLLQGFGISAYLLPIYIWALAWKWVRLSPIDSPWIRIFGCLALWFCMSAACGLITAPIVIAGTLPISGIIGRVIADFLVARLNVIGAAIATAVAGVLALYLASTFEMSTLARWLSGPIAKWRQWHVKWRAAREARRQRAIEAAKVRAAERTARRNARAEANSQLEGTKRKTTRQPLQPSRDFESPAEPVQTEAEEIPIRTLEHQPVTYTRSPDEEDVFSLVEAKESRPATRRNPIYKLPPTTLLNEIPIGNPYDSQELKDVAARIKSKLEEFNVRGSVVQINPGPVVTTFEYKPEAGIKYSRITTLNEDLCLGLQAESILIERLPGKPTVGIEVPNTRRELISLRAILESREFEDSASKMT
ncbi:MAG: DNA translocase FtsK 4TM domain-containing protein, partial [Acidobacteriaceae bacterium]|nr:DNA translocase FtsK 4TM domain-containing protein [Acidobacteriaceae bacterium]